MRMHWKAVFIFCLVGISAKAQNDTLFVVDRQGLLLAQITESKVYTAPEQVGYNIRGNQLFQGNSQQASAYLYLLQVEDVFSKKAGLVYEPDGKTIRYITRKGAFYLGDYPSSDPSNMLLYLVAEGTHKLQVYHGGNEELLGSIEGNLSQAAYIVMAAHLFIETEGLEEELLQNRSRLQAEALLAAPIATMYQTQWPAQQTYTWNGEILTLILQGQPVLRWSFNGREVKPLDAGAMPQQWIWEGEILKPAFQPAIQLQWVWNGQILQPYWDPSPDDMWRYEGGEMRPLYRIDPGFVWTVEGDMPKSLVALIALGYLR